jgi:hypothetical protein
MAESARMVGNALVKVKTAMPVTIPMRRIVTRSSTMEKPWLREGRGVLRISVLPQTWRQGRVEAADTSRSVFTLTHPPFAGASVFLD